ncbi:TetR/AcrR family transcriptional regulator [Sphingomonas sp. ID0503]|uniref:TetR/AcrR family transcriptional regulator n=1 Tax=Sphingomonas sp. ID0503 TaxID=3399691 RepID=UPI003AFAEFA6
MSDLSSREDLIEQTIRAVAESGLQGMSLRNVAAGAGVSTASIFHFFGNKTNLLHAAAEKALMLESELHQALLAELTGLEIETAQTTELIVSYVTIRRTALVPRFWLEMAFNGTEDFPGEAPVRSWREIRRTFWTKVTGDAVLARFLIDHLLMEEVYAVALHDDFSFWPLVMETARVFASRADGGRPPSGGSNKIGEWLLSKPQQFAIHEEPPANGVANRLLTAASTRIFSGGLGAINDRAIARIAGTAPSMIAYNFGNSATFLQKAIWRAMLHEIPGSLDPAIRAETRRDDLDDWAGVMTSMVEPAAAGKQPGFYLGYTRITGQAALLSARRKDLVPLIRHLRIIDGTGTYRACQLYWPAATDFGPAEARAFGIWIKGASISNNIVKAERTLIASTVKRAAEFFGRRPPATKTGAIKAD